MAQTVQQITARCRLDSVKGNGGVYAGCWIQVTPSGAAHFTKFKAPTARNVP
jgi:hypothetical protein